MAENTAGGMELIRLKTFCKPAFNPDPKEPVIDVVKEPRLLSLA
jgi:hypothetical protein